MSMNFKPNKNPFFILLQAYVQNDVEKYNRLIKNIILIIQKQFKVN